MELSPSAHTHPWSGESSCCYDPEVFSISFDSDAHGWTEASYGVHCLFHDSGTVEPVIISSLYTHTDSSRDDEVVEVCTRSRLDASSLKTVCHLSINETIETMGCRRWCRGLKPFSVHRTAVSQHLLGCPRVRILPGQDACYTWSSCARAHHCSP
jgi:hypothetical protein